MAWLQPARTNRICHTGGLSIRHEVAALAQETRLFEERIVAAQAFADVATIGILQHRALEETGRLNSQLQFALDSRVVIEQAKGVVAHTRNISVDEAFAVIRTHARSNHLTIRDVAGRLVNRELKL